MCVPFEHSTACLKFIKLDPFIEADLKAYKPTASRIDTLMQLLLLLGFGYEQLGYMNHQQAIHCI
jgi:hypothetical protein